MGQRVSRTDFEWSYTDEPHATRRKDIMSKYPEVKTLMGHDHNLKWKVLAIVAFQLISAWFISQLSWGWIIVLAYCLGGTLNHSLTLAIHEISHNLAFGHTRPLSNVAVGMLANIPLIIPMQISFKKYHLRHHRYQGDEVRDVDLPTRIEGELFRTSVSKMLFLILMPIFYTVRPLLVDPLPTSSLEKVTIVVQIIFDALLYWALGPRAIIYLLAGLLLATGLHPMSGHFIAEHYVMKQGQETYSYYGPLNFLAFNVGYHNEHHDFPFIPGCRLPLLKKMAPEFYDNLPSYTSWVWVLYKFIVDPTMSPLSRIKRKSNMHNSSEHDPTNTVDSTNLKTD